LALDRRPSRGEFAALDQRPIIVALAGPNGAGKSTFHAAFLAECGLRFVNADLLARELRLEAYEASRIAQTLRETLIRSRESFVFETVFSNPVQEKLDFLKKAVADGYAVVLIFIGIDSAETSEIRVCMRVSQGGHDVPTEKLQERFPRILANLKATISGLPLVWIFDNSDLAHPFRWVARYENGQRMDSHGSLPKWVPNP